MDEIRNVVIIGTGNVASNLGLALSRVGIDIAAVYGRDPEKANELAVLCNAKAVSDLAAIETGHDLYIIAVTDDSIGEVAGQLKLDGELIVHSSGSVEMKVLANTSDRIGVFYPFQTFIKGRTPDFANIPICIEAGNLIDGQKLANLAARISSRVLNIDSAQRSLLHLAGVFASNFVNFNLLIAAQLLTDNGLDPSLLDALVRETAEKAMTISPVDAQTGPARRNDRKIMNKHLNILNEYPEFKEIYRVLSESIIEKYWDHE